MKKFTLSFVLFLTFEVSGAGIDGEIERALEQILKGDITTTSSTLSRRTEKEKGKINHGKYKVEIGDTLDRVIYKTFKGSKIRKSMIRKAYVRANPAAFRRGNPNWLYAGVELNLPKKDDFLNVVFVEGKGLKTKSSGKGNWVTFP
jgi:hypothetical protein